MNLVETARRMMISKTAVFRTIWFVVVVMMFGLLVTAVLPLLIPDK